MSDQKRKGCSGESLVVLYQKAMKDLAREFRQRAEICERIPPEVIPGGTTSQFDYGCAKAFTESANRLDYILTHLSKYNAKAGRIAGQEEDA